jgi:hypothetical protein
MQSQALRAQGEYQKRMYEINAKYALVQGEDAIRRGDEEAKLVQRRGRQVYGAQRAAFAAQGVDVDYGSAAAVQRDTRETTMRDELTAKNNAWREAWGYRAQSAQASASGDFAKLGADANARNTMISGLTDSVGYGLKAYAYYQGGRGSDGSGGGGYGSGIPPSQPIKPPFNWYYGIGGMPYTPPGGK